ncbi:ATP-dependent metallopeptidase FtsH/Yme1/Tma family protein [Francisella tularensis]|uniref:ATP-dependent metallopeptidase FtsH/Yme1/Tma family protein n=1 Tax=Francisella tularensis TaxID=263 RepID=UPI0038783AE0
MIINIIFWNLIISRLIICLNCINYTNGSSININYLSFITKLKNNQISVIEVDDRTIKCKTN